MPRKHYGKGKLGSKLPNELQYKQGRHEKTVRPVRRWRFSQRQHPLDAVGQLPQALADRAIAPAPRQLWHPTDCIYMTTVRRWRTKEHPFGWHSGGHPLRTEHRDPSAIRLDAPGLSNQAQQRGRGGADAGEKPVLPWPGVTRACHGHASLPGRLSNMGCGVSPGTGSRSAGRASSGWIWQSEARRPPAPSTTEKQASGVQGNSLGEGSAYRLDQYAFRLQGVQQPFEGRPVTGLANVVDRLSQSDARARA